MRFRFSRLVRNGGDSEKIWREGRRLWAISFADDIIILGAKGQTLREGRAQSYGLKHRVCHGGGLPNSPSFVSRKGVFCMFLSQLQRSSGEMYLPLGELALALVSTADLVDPRLFDHHLRVAYLAYQLGDALGFTEERKRNLLFAGLFHDLGAFSLRERLEALQFDFSSGHTHAFVTASLLAKFPLFSEMASIVRFHHLLWNDGAGSRFGALPVPFESHLVHLADRVSILFRVSSDPLWEMKKKVVLIRDFVPRVFAPTAFAALEALLDKEYVWFDFASPLLREILADILARQNVTLTLQESLAFCRFAAHLVDFRSPFTATHSEGVAAIACAVGRFMGLEKIETDALWAAGLLHDLGKIAIPGEILEKPSALNRRELHIMRQHPYLTYQVLSRVRDVKPLAEIAANHHERLDGRGYPWRKNASQLCLASRIVAVSDVFTALSEERPYRPPLTFPKTVRILQDMVRAGSLDKDVVGCVLTYGEKLLSTLRVVQKKVSAGYRAFRENAHKDEQCSTYR